MFCGTFMCVLICFSCVWLFSTLWTIACQAPLSVGFSRQEYWSGLPCLPPGGFPNPGFEPASFLCLLHWQVGSLQLALPGKPHGTFTDMLYPLWPSGAEGRLHHAPWFMSYCHCGSLQSLSWFFLSWFLFILFPVPVSPTPRYSGPCTLPWNPLEPVLTKYHIINTSPCHLKEKNFFEKITFKEYLIICKTWS